MTVYISWANRHAQPDHLKGVRLVSVYPHSSSAGDQPEVVLHFHQDGTPQREIPLDLIHSITIGEK